MRNLFILLFAFFIIYTGHAQSGNPDLAYIKNHYDKFEYQIPMRDGVKLFTSVYLPKDDSKSYPILLQRTPYSCAPYGEDQYSSRIGPSMELIKEGYIFVEQDVRGRFMSEGTFTWMGPIKPNKTGKETDESTDTYDTIEWLINNLDNDNGKVGTYGGSYNGYYVMTGIVDAHPALKAAIPSAPMVDLWKGDDVSHNGAFLMPHNLGFLARFGQPRPEPTTQWPPSKWEYWTPDGYEFYMDLGILPNVNKKYFNEEIIHWQEYIEHPVYDEFWQSRDISQHLDDVKPAVLTIGGWFDSQDLYGPLKAYETIEKENPDNFNALVMGPWYHGSWMRSDGDHCANIQWGSKTGVYYRQELELPFFNYYLKDKGSISGFSDALVFDTGRKKWEEYPQWPPENALEKSLYLHVNGNLSFKIPTAEGQKPAYREYISDPEKPVPFTAEITTRYGNDWMVEDQRFAARRPDVLVFESQVLKEDLSVVGAIEVNLLASSSGTDADFIVKVIDVFPHDTPDPNPNPQNIKMGGYQMLVRGDPIRAKFRNSLSEPKPLVPNEPTPLKFELRDIHHTFKKGHKIMVQVQSSWFPMIDRNPHKFVDLFNDVKESDFQKATQRIYCSGPNSSHLKLRVLPPENPNLAFYNIADEDVNSIDGILSALYGVISGPAGQKRDWDRFRALFAPNARLIATGKDQNGQVRYRTMSPEDYVHSSGSYLEENGFYEMEIGRKVEQFGLVTHVFSTYQSQRVKDGPIIARGINSIQLSYDGERYWIVNIFWNGETEENPIPGKYLEK